MHASAADETRAKPSGPKSESSGNILDGCQNGQAKLATDSDSPLRTFKEYPKVIFQNHTQLFDKIQLLNTSFLKKCYLPCTQFPDSRKLFVRKEKFTASTAPIYLHSRCQAPTRFTEEDSSSPKPIAQLQLFLAFGSFYLLLRARMFDFLRGLRTCLHFFGWLLLSSMKNASKNYLSFIHIPSITALRKNGHSA